MFTLKRRTIGEKVVVLACHQDSRVCIGLSVGHDGTIFMHDEHGNRLEVTRAEFDELMANGYPALEEATALSQAAASVPILAGAPTPV